MTKAIITDLNRCVGCLACSVACKAVNNVPIGSYWNKVVRVGPNPIPGGSGQYPDVYMYFLPISCQHCENPACVKVCPVGATYKDPETGVVRQDYDKCIGCRMCMAACPYNARTFNWNDPVRATGASYGDARVPERARGVMEKCTLCKERTDEGDEPMCVRCCPADARVFGDLDDPESEASKLLEAHGDTVEVLLKEAGTNPQVFYIRSY